MLASGDATRSQLASVATLASRAPSVGLLPLLKRLLDENLRRYRAFREEARADQLAARHGQRRSAYVMDTQYQRAFQAIDSARDRGADARISARTKISAISLLWCSPRQWTAANEPSDGERFWGGVDFSRVAGEARRARQDPAATSAEAEAIFSAIEPLIADEATEEQKKHAVALGIVAARLPHGQRDATIQKLISLAPRRSRAALLQNLILSGESIDIEMVKNGLAEVFEAAKTERWILSDGYELKEWLRLLPFANPPAEAFAVVRGLPDDQRRVGPAWKK